MKISEEDYAEMYSLMHYGTPRHSGRYPWGSGQTPEQRSSSFLGEVQGMRKQKMSDTAIAKALGFDSTTKFRAAIAISTNVKKQENIATAQKLKAKGMSNGAIAKQMGLKPSQESTIRAWLAPGAQDKADILKSTSDMLRKRVDEGHFVDIGKGVPNQLGLAPTKLGTAVSVLEHEGYKVYKVPVKQLGTIHDTNTKVLCPPGTEWKDVMQNQDKIKTLQDWTQDGGRSFNEPQPPISADSRKLQVVFAEDGGSKADGVIYVRPGAPRLDMGSTHYAQGRIMVDGTHYLKGMVVQKDDLPPGVDMQFHTNKPKGTPILGEKGDTVLKPVQRKADGSVDEDNPFGASINRQILDHNDKVSSAINIVNDEATWDDWSRNLASQMLSKQKPELVKSQLDVTYANKKAQLDEIMGLTNPTVKTKLLLSYADDMDSSAVHLKAAAMPRQKTHVILPINSLKENEIFAPNFNHGESVVLIRYPHGGKFEIPTLTVNNKNREAIKTLHADNKVAVGINHKVAGRLSGADFDGDTVVVIPNNRGRITTQSPLEGLKGFDPQTDYKGYEGMKTMKNTQTEMGKISNLITDMTIRGATDQELAQAVRHSMVVIDAEKHGLDYRRSAADNGIAALKKKYQAGPQGGATTLISRSTGDTKVPDMRLRRASEGGSIDPKTGRLIYVPSGKTRPVRVKDPKTGEVTWEKEGRLKEVQRGSREAGVTDAHSLIEGQGTPVERLYADYSNKVRSLADQARLETLRTPRLETSPSAKQTYAKEVASLNAKLNDALKNAPLERQAQIVAAAQVRLKKQDNPMLATDKDLLKKTENLELKRARSRLSPDGRPIVDINAKEWEAIQAGAVSHSKLKDILDHADVDKVKEMATPRTTTLVSSAKLGRAKALAASGYTQAEIANELGISVSTLRRALSG